MYEIFIFLYEMLIFLYEILFIYRSVRDISNEKFLEKIKKRL